MVKETLHIQTKIVIVDGLHLVKKMDKEHMYIMILE